LNHSEPHSCGCAGTGSHPVDVLGEEHRTILPVLEAAEAEIGRIDGGAGIRQTFWIGICDFLENYADRCHHGKEEDLLFAELEQAGLPRNMGPTACLREEHETMRGLRRRMAQALETGDARGLCRVSHQLIDTLREHIRKEDQVLFPMAKLMLGHEAVRRLRQGFQRVEHELMGEGTHCRYQALAQSLCARPDAVGTG
jgi:hemerythrin-like domain-containing protein